MNINVRKRNAAPRQNSPGIYYRGQAMSGCLEARQAMTPPQLGSESLGHNAPR